MVATVRPEEKRLRALLKELARGVVPGAVTWLLGAITGIVASVSTHSQTGVLPLTTLAFFGLAGAGGAVCFLLAGMYIWEPVRRFTTAPKPLEGRTLRVSLVNELDLVETQTRNKIREVTRRLDRKEIEEDEWFEKAEVLFSMISISRGLRKAYPVMVQASKKATWAIAIAGLATLFVGIYVATLPQDPSSAAFVGAITFMVVFLGIIVGFFNANLVPVRSQWGTDVSKLCDSTDYAEMKDVIKGWAEDAVRSRKAVP